ncbi:TPA: hypothetical protein ACQUHH_005654 [Bacillus mobilis]
MHILIPSLSYTIGKIQKVRFLIREELSMAIAIAVLTFIGGVAPLVTQLLKAFM